MKAEIQSQLERIKVIQAHLVSRGENVDPDLKERAFILKNMLNTPVCFLRSYHANYVYKI